MSIPFAAVSSAALAQADRLVADWFPAGKFVSHEFKIGNLRGDPADSLSVNVLR